MSNIAMSNETDLDWLARNVHEWNSELGFVFMVKIKNGENIHMYARREGIYQLYFLGDNLTNAKPYSKAEWLARRAELQGEIDSAKACADGGLAGLVAAAFKPFTSIEDNQELNMSQQQEVKQDGGWFERGELPPAGIECEAKARGDAWKRVRTIGIDNEGAMVVQFLDDAIPYHGCATPSRFRPIRTERELSIEEMCQVAGLDDLMFGLVAGKLYDADYRKDPK